MIKYQVQKFQKPRNTRQMRKITLRVRRICCHFHPSSVRRKASVHPMSPKSLSNGNSKFHSLFIGYLSFLSKIDRQNLQLPMGDQKASPRTSEPASSYFSSGKFLTAILNIKYMLSQFSESETWQMSFRHHGNNLGPFAFGIIADLKYGRTEISSKQNEN